MKWLWHEITVYHEKYKSSNHNKKSRKKLIKQINDKELVDAFRHLLVTTRKYTLKKLSPLQKGRLDCFLTDQNLRSFVRNSDMLQV